MYSNLELKGFSSTVAPTKKPTAKAYVPNRLQQQNVEPKAHTLGTPDSIAPEIAPCSNSHPQRDANTLETAHTHRHAVLQSTLLQGARTRHCLCFYW